MLWEFCFNRFRRGMVAKHSINPRNFYYASTLTAAQDTAIPEEVDGKDRMTSEQTLISSLYLCLGEKGQNELHKRRPHLDLSTTRYSRVLDTIETEFKKERNQTYETFQLLAQKQHIGESLEQFHSVLSGMAARCNFGTLETRILRDVFNVNMNKREAQNELCRSTKTPEEVYRIVLSYERGYKYAKSYGLATGGATTSGTTGVTGAFQTKTEPVGTIRGGYQNNRQRGRVSFRGRAHIRGGASKRCYNCSRCPAKNATCNFCRKTGHYEEICRGKRTNRGRPAVGLFQNQEDVDASEIGDAEDTYSQHENSVGWVNTPEKRQRSWDSVISGDYVVMAIKSRREAELKVSGARLSIKINGKQTNVWIDSGSPISIFTVGELKRTLDTASVSVNAPAPKDDEFRDYGNNPLRLLRKMNVSLEINGWVTDANMKVIGGNTPSIIGRDLMPNLGLQTVQRTPEEKVMSVQGEQPGAETTGEEDPLDPWQTYFSKQFNNLFHRVGKIENFKVHAEFFETLITDSTKRTESTDHIAR